jgi:hypothetical protein
MPEENPNGVEKVYVNGVEEPPVAKIPNTSGLNITQLVQKHIDTPEDGEETQ